ncbi:MAG: UDP-4-amino-4,6-dideoxy-N-acetyl-beta-L-altrosamine transaminase, partial [Candidatus Eisenbacteria bacterium]|nr:UDP-4-amino-4,6-dideoxy-N-acetyl-beta-L-altrosamine transaminase [Candidatus Eisenbacteria bacterium]
MSADLPAAEGGSPVRKSFLPFARPSICEGDIESVVQTLRSGWLTVGPQTREFERIVAGYIGVENAAAVHSCTAGMHLAMVALGVEPGDEVIVPALNFAAAPNTIIHIGARPVLVDVDPKTLNVTAGIIDAAVTERTRLAVPVHFGGHPCEMDEIMEMARGRRIGILGDGAHAIGAELDSRRIGSIADATAFSFYVTKGITTGEGGIVTSKDEELIERIRRLSLHGMSSDAWKRYSERGPWYYEILEPGYKYNMNDLQASLGICQMERVDEFRLGRARIARAYDEAFSGLPALEIPSEREGGLHAWHLYPIQIDPSAVTIGRDAFIRALLDEGVGVSVHFIPIH